MVSPKQLTTGTGVPSTEVPLPLCTGGVWSRHLKTDETIEISENSS